MTRMLYRVNEVAEMLGLGRSKAYELVGSGTIASVRIDRAVRVPATAVDEFVKGLVTATPEAPES